MKRFLSMLVCMSMIFTLFVSVPVSATTVTYSGPQSIYYMNFDGVTDATSISGFYAYKNSGTIEVVTEDSNNILRLSSTGKTTQLNQYRITATKSTPAADKYVIEYKIRPNLSTTGIFKAQPGNYYGVETATFYKNKIGKSGFSDTSVGTYSDGEWYTVTVVFDGVDSATTPTTTTRDIYINGKLKTRDIEDSVYTQACFVNQTDKMRTTIYQYNAVANSSSSVDIDYIRYYASNDTFAAKLPNDSAVALDSVEVYFNNIPTEEELKEKISVVDLAGTKVADVSSYTYNDFDTCEDYAQSITLNFSEALEPGTDYKLKIDGLTDFAVNTLTTDLTFTTTSDIENKDYVAPQEIYYQDFENITAGTITSWTANSTIPGFYMTTQENTAAVVSDSAVDRKYFKLTGIAGKYSAFQIYDTSATMPDNPDKYIVEYKIRPTNVYGSGSAVYSTYGGSYGLPTLGLYQYNFNTNTLDATTEVGTYENSEWYTIHIVYDGEVDDSGNTVRDIYINGVLAKKDISQAGTSLNFMTNGTGHMITTLAYLGRADGSLEVDYIKYYASADDFTVKVPETTDIATDIGIEVQFNNIPDIESLIANAVILDADGNEVCGIKDVTYNNNFNPGKEYAQSLTLNFAEVLDKNKTYTLKLNGVKDISDNKVYHTENFTTANVDSFEYSDFTFAEDSTTVSVSITKNVNASKDYTLIIAGYDGYSGGVKMVSVAEKKISTVKGTNVSYTSKAIDVTNCDYVRAFLWDGMKPVIIQGQKTIGQ